MNLEAPTTPKTGRVHLFSRASAAFGFIVGSSVLLGWLLDITSLKSVFPNYVPMKANTALAFILMGISLWILSNVKKDPTRQTERTIAQTCAAFAALVGLLTLLEYLTNLDFGIDQLFFHEPQGTIGTSHPGRMAPNSAMNFLLIGVALILAGFPQGRVHRVAQLLALTALAISLLALLGYLYGVRTRFGIPIYTEMALHAAATFSVLGLGLLFLHPERGLIRVFAADTVGGSVARRLIPAAIGLAAVVGWVGMAGYQAGLYSTEFGLVLFAFLNTVVLISFVWTHALSIHKAEEERRAVAKALSFERNLLRTIIDAVPHSIYAKDTESQFLTCNKATASALEAETPEEMIGKTDFDFLPQEWAIRNFEMERSLLESGEPLLYEDSVVSSKRGKTVWTYVSKVPLRDAKGKIVGLVGANIDTTDLREKEEKLRESEERYRLLFHNSLDPVYLYEADSKRVLEANEAFLHLLGYASEEAKKLTIYDIVAHDRKSIDNYIRMALQTQGFKIGERKWRRKDGSLVDVDVSASKIEQSGKIVLFVVARDITERKRAQEALRLFRTLTDQTNDGIEVVDPETGRFLDVNERACLAHGYTREEYLALTVPDIDPLVAARPWKETSHEVRRLGSSVFESQHRRKDGSVFPVEVSVTFLRFVIFFFLAVVRDITERKRAEEALRKKDEHHKAVIENIFKFVPEGLLVLARNLNLMKQNKAFEEMVQKYAERLGYTEEELAEKIIEQLRGKISTGDTTEIRIPKKDE